MPVPVPIPAIPVVFGTDTSNTGRFRCRIPAFMMLIPAGLFACSNGKSRKKFTFKWKITAVRLQVTPTFYAVQMANYVQYKFATFLGGNAGDSTVDHVTVLSLM
jgi:hypothetical protein